jgi:hypothetical protein
MTTDGTDAVTEPAFVRRSEWYVEPLTEAVRFIEATHYAKGAPAASDLPWAKWSWQCCPARVEPNPSGPYGRCELRRGHEGDHALERGFDTPRWSTRWTA